MKQTPHGLKIDGCKGLMKNLEENGLERKITKGMWQDKNKRK